MDKKWWKSTKNGAISILDGGRTILDGSSTIFCRFSPFFIDFHDLRTFVAIYILSRFTHFFRKFFLAKIAFSATSHVFCMYAGRLEDWQNCSRQGVCWLFWMTIMSILGLWRRYCSSDFSVVAYLCWCLLLSMGKLLEVWLLLECKCLFTHWASYEESPYRQNGHRSNTTVNGPPLLTLTFHASK